MTILTLSWLLSIALLGDGIIEKEETIDIEQYQSKMSNLTAKSVHTVDDSTAIAIEFLRLRDSILEDKIGARGDRFLGFLNGRLRVTPPNWWSDELRDGVVHKNRSISFGSRLPKGHWLTTKQGLKFGGLSGAIMKGDELKLFKGGTAPNVHQKSFVVLHRKDFERWLTGERADWDIGPVNPDGAIAANIQGDNFAVAFECPETGVRQATYLFLGDVETGKPIWVAHLTNAVDFGQYSGTFSGADTEIVMDDNRVIVFCSHSVSLSLQVFDRATGDCKCFFATDLLERMSLKYEREAK